MAILYLAGLSRRTLALVSNRLLGVEVSPQTVMNSLKIIEKQAVSWLERPIKRDYWALYIDGTNFRVQRRGTTEKEPSLVVVGLDQNNHTSILAIEPGTKENTESWENVFDSLIKRGLNPKSVRIGIMDGLPGLESTFKNTFHEAVTARCWVHALKNAMNKTPARFRELFKKKIHRVMYAGSQNEARTAFKQLKTDMGSDCARAISCLEKDLDSLLVHYQFEKNLWRVLRTTNPIERVNKELKRRTKSMETMGSETLEKVLAFTALRLEFNWSKVPANASQYENLMWIKRQPNQIESTMDTLTH